MNQLFERLSLQGHFKRVIEQYGQDTALDLIQSALEREFKYLDNPDRLKYHYEQDKDTPVT